MSTEEIDETVGELRISQKVEGHFNQGPQTSTRDFRTLNVSTQDFSIMNPLLQEFGTRVTGVSAEPIEP